MNDITPKTIELSIGHEDKSGVVHREVVFGKRIMGRDLFDLDDDPRAQGRTQRSDMIVRKAITRFGTLPLPVELDVLMSLDRLDRRDLTRGYNEFAIESAGDRAPEFLSDSKVKLAFGFVRDGVVYDLVTFGKRLTGYDELESDTLGLSGLSQACFLIGKEIVQLSQSEGTQKIDGSVELSAFDTLDGADVFTLNTASEKWLDSFRPKRSSLQGKESNDGAAAGNEDGMERAANP